MMTASIEGRSLRPCLTVPLPLPFHPGTDVQRNTQVCSVSLTNMNVYCCLVCGKYFRGRGKSTEAHTHSVEAFHHVFMNLHNAKIYCLPGQ